MNSWALLSGLDPNTPYYARVKAKSVSSDPDGATLAFAEYDQTHYQTGSIYQLSAGGGDAHRLVSGALSPAYRPASGGAGASPAP